MRSTNLLLLLLLLYIDPDVGVPLGIWYVSAQGVPNASMMGLPGGRKSFKLGLVVLIKYRL